MGTVVAEFIAFVRQRAMPAQFVSAYEQIAQQFLAAFPQVPPAHFGPEEVDAFLKRAARGGASEQQLRNARTAAEALVWYLKHRARPSLQPPPASTTRSEERVSFIRDVEVTDLGACRSSDLSSRGIFVETLAALNVGDQLELRFRLEQNDPPITVLARVVYSHPMGGGLSFREVPPGVQARIDRYMAMARGTD